MKTVAIKRRGNRLPLVENLEPRTFMTVATTTVATRSAVNLTFPNGSGTFTATVTPAESGGPAPTGTINFFSYNGVYPSETVTLDSNGSASITEPANLLGAMAYIAIYSGDANYAGSVSGPAFTSVNSSPLVATFASDSAPKAIVTNAKSAPGVAIMSVTNNSNSLVKGPESFNLYAARYLGGAVFTYTPVGNRVLKNLVIPAGKTVKVPVAINEKAVSSTPGIYFLSGAVTNSLLQTSFFSDDFSIASVSTYFTVADPFEQLSPTIKVLKMPSSVVAGGTTVGAALVSVTNNGNAIVGGLTTVELLLTPDGTAANGTVLATRTLRLPIAAGRTLPVLVPIRNIPAIAAGTYSVIARTIDPSQAAGVSAAFASTITVEAPVVNITAISTQLVPSTLTQRAAKLIYLVTVSNTGNITGSGPLTITSQFYNDANPIGTFSSTTTVFANTIIRPRIPKRVLVRESYPGLGALPDGVFNVKLEITYNNITIDIAVPKPVTVIG